MPSTVQEHEQAFVAPDSAGRPDLLLISSDGVKFRLHMKHLEIGSGLFQDMLAGSTAGRDEEGVVKLQLVDKDCETANMLELVLPYFYNVVPPRLEEIDIDDLLCLLRLGDKWRICKVVEASADALINEPHSRQSAFRVYEAAIKYGHIRLQDAVAKNAAGFTPFVKNPFAFLDRLGIAGAQKLYEQLKVGATGH